MDLSVSRCDEGKGREEVSIFASNFDLNFDCRSQRPDTTKLLKHQNTSLCLQQRFAESESSHIIRAERLIRGLSTAAAGG